MTQIVQTLGGDIAITNNKFTLTDNDSDEEIVQRLKQNLKTFLNEWFLDKTLGLPYLQIIFVKGTPVSVIEASFKGVIIATSGISTIERFEDLDLDAATRGLTVDFDVTTINGNTITINEVL